MDKSKTLLLSRGLVSHSWTVITILIALLYFAGGCQGSESLETQEFSGFKGREGLLTKGSLGYSISGIQTDVEVSKISKVYRTVKLDRDPLRRTSVKVQPYEIGVVNNGETDFSHIQLVVSDEDKIELIYSNHTKGVIVEKDGEAIFELSSSKRKVMDALKSQKTRISGQHIICEEDVHGQILELEFTQDELISVVLFKAAEDGN